ncbi:protein of unknown function [Shinella sp. WSC3-e]|nr:hypothetical protein SHINE37_40629 [Rhizobiaceae bacterium]CAK7255304.1 protein of unknown function [Shinella sp. WSC3-e]
MRHFSVHINFWGKGPEETLPAFRRLAAARPATILNGDR